VTLATREWRNSKRWPYLLKNIFVILFDVICGEIKKTNVGIGVMKTWYFIWKICSDLKKKNEIKT